MLQRIIVDNVLSFYNVLPDHCILYSYYSTFYNHVTVQSCSVTLCTLSMLINLQYYVVT